jgi:hypothetical protein
MCASTRLLLLVLRFIVLGGRISTGRQDGEGTAPAAVVLSKVWAELPYDRAPFTPELLHNRTLPGSWPLQQVQQLLASAG